MNVNVSAWSIRRPVPGLVLFLFVVFGTFWTLFRVRALARSDPQRSWLADYATALMIGLAGYCVAGAFVSLAYFDLFYTFVVLAGILLREARSTQVETTGQTEAVITATSAVSAERSSPGVAA